MLRWAQHLPKLKDEINRLRPIPLAFPLESQPIIDQPEGLVKSPGYRFPSTTGDGIIFRVDHSRDIAHTTLGNRPRYGVWAILATIGR